MNATQPFGSFCRFSNSAPFAWRFTPRIRHAWRAATGSLAFALGTTIAAFAVPVFQHTGGPDGPGGIGGGAIAFGVAPLGAPLSPGAPTYLANNFNGRADILTNPGIGLTADPSIPNNTSFVVGAPWGPPTYLYLTQSGGGNVHGPFGAGTAVIYGPTFGFQLADGGIPGGVSASYQIMSWDATFTDAAGSGAGTLGNYIAMAGTVPAVQDLALLALRTQLQGPNIGVVEVPGLILAVERTGPATYNALALQDGLGGAAMPMPGGWGIKINPVTGQFLAMAYNVFPFAIPAGETFVARVTATVYADPADLHLPFDSFFDVFTEIDIGPGMQAFGGGPAPALPNNMLLTGTEVPEPTAMALVLMGLVAGLLRRLRF